MHTGLAEALSWEHCAHSVTLSRKSAQAPYDFCLPSALPGVLYLAQVIPES